MAEAKQLWSAIGSVRSLLELLPDTPDSVTRLDLCIGAIRHHVEAATYPQSNQQPLAKQNPALDDELVPVTYALGEANRLVKKCKEVMVMLASQVGLEKTLCTRLVRELNRSEDYLEPDDRGTIWGRLAPTGLTEAQLRNNGRLDALAGFLAAIRKQPFPVVFAALTAMKEVSIPPDILSVDVEREVLVFRGTAYTPGVEACAFVELLLKSISTGRPVSTAHIEARVRKTHVGNACLGGSLRADRLKKKLPPALQIAIETEQIGSWLLVDQLLSDS